MAVWEVRCVDQNGDRFWENVWHVDVGELGDVPPALTDAFIAFSRATLLDLFSVARVTRRPAGSHDEFIEVAVNLAGTLSSSGFHALPLFNVVRVLLFGGVGREGLKLLRGAIIDGDLLDEDFHLKSTFISLIQGSLDTLLNAASDAGCTLVYGATNKPIVSGTVDSLIGMRQQHRKRRRSV